MTTEVNIKTTIHKGQQPTKRQLERLKALKDRPIVFDDEMPEYTLAEFEEMRLAAIKKRSEQKKEVVAIRLSPATLEKAKSFGKGYTGFIARLVENGINDRDLVLRSL